MASSEHAAPCRSVNASHGYKAQRQDPWSWLAGLSDLPAHAGLDARSGYAMAVLLPLAGAARMFHWNALVVLVVNLTAIVFLSDIISSTADELADQLGHLQGALIGATLGNAVELTVRAWMPLEGQKYADLLSTSSQVFSRLLAVT